MENDKVYLPEVIQDNPFPTEVTEAIDNPTKESGDTFSPTSIKEKTFPKRLIAQETISSALNTKSRKILGEFQFTQMGALQIGTYQNGVSGDIRISPSGIVARNTAGDTTFAIDGETGDAVFKGTITAGAVVAGAVVTGEIDLGYPNDDGLLLVFDSSGLARVLIGKF